MGETWRSSTLNCLDDDPDCKVCRFLRGDRETDVLLEVIRILDETLGKSEACAFFLGMCK